MNRTGNTRQGGRRASAGGHRAELYNLPPTTAPNTPPPPPPPSQPSQPSNTIDTTPGLISDIKGLLTQIEAQHQSSPPTAPGWVTTAHRIIAAGDAAQNEFDRRQFAHQAKLQNLHVQLKGVTLEMMGLMARLEQLRAELDEAHLGAARGANGAVWRATRMAVDVLIEAHQGDNEGCAGVRKELEGLDDVHDLKAASDVE
ncbi:uncharacterized protein BO66DRAFT_438829 [Aspergillus aculeatinus CBS 121060]|uniref:Uncharacterized protein n=1 Tax=Aspergillus aculeatinus CBS 121060 TaxID=1448322 RepID=A0ACD1H7H7_9EURO|nr:hypothetical protein BO66DRAFT_438829 [Aspergillus aculeatinus CBS 121060]RAH69755.1 hypothetical protein BO66DRAFT_438829 [Aspergillus aculeatinus CBS 121060]